MSRASQQVLALLVVQPNGLRAPEILAAVRPKISQPTLSRTLADLRARGEIVSEGRARATRYHARERIDLGALRSRLMHECVAKRLIRDSDLRKQALDRLQKLRQVNPHGRRYHEQWQQLLQGPLPDLLRIMTEPSERADDLRKESPLSVFVPVRERDRIFRSTRAS